MASRFILPLADVGNGISPSDGAKLTFFNTGTSDLKDTFTDETALTENTNPVIANGDGVFPEIWIVGSYKVRLTDKNDNQANGWEEDPIIENVNFTSISSRGSVTLTAAKASTSLANGNIVQTSGFDAERDGGAAVYFYDSASSTTANGVTVHALDTLAGRLKLIHNGEIDSRIGGVLYDNGTDNFTAFGSITSAPGIFEIICNGNDGAGLIGTAQIEATNRYLETVMNEQIAAGIRLFANQTLTVNSSAILLQVAWAGIGADNDDAGNMVAAMSIDNIMIRGKGHIRGNFPPGSTHTGRATDSNHIVNIGNSTNVTIKDVLCDYAWTDGIVITYFANVAAANNCRNVNLINVHGSENRRNGLSVAGCVGGSVIGGSYKTNVGTSPEAGIDLEPNFGITNIVDGKSFVKDFVVTGIVTGGNRRSGISITSPNSVDRSEAVNITVIGCSAPDRIVAERLSSCSFIGNTCAATLDDPDSPFTPFDAIDIIDSNDCLIVGNTITEARRHGINLRTAFSVGGTEIAITGATQANPVVITVASNTFSDGASVYVDAVSGMTEINNKRFIVANGGATTFELNHLDNTTVDGTGFTAYTSGGKASNSRICDNNLVVGNIIRKVGRETTATYAGINCDTQKNTIALNSIRLFGSGNEPAWGLKLTTAAVDNCLMLNDTKGFRTGGAVGFLDQSEVGANNTIMHMGDVGTKKIYINTVQDVDPSSSNQGMMIDDSSIVMAFTGGGAATMLNFFDGTGAAGRVEVDGAGHTKYYTDITNNVFHTAGAGTPEAALVGGVGSTFARNDGGAGTSFYVKEVGTGNTGWVAK